MLDLLLHLGYEYAFVSNADNLGAELDLRILGYLAAKDIPFLMEVADQRPPTARAATWRSARTASSSSANRRSARRMKKRNSRTSGASAISTPTTVGSTCGRWRGGWRSTAA